ncbi:thrombospondin type-1 domain-containing protein 7A-like [Saccoglossus kowalevskii]
MYYCQKLERPVAIQSCLNCSEKCVTSTWSTWSTCSSTCGPATKYRSRRVLRLPTESDSQSCGALSEFRDCTDLSPCPEPVYTWKIGTWTSCRKINATTVNNSTCGVGQRSRFVTCLDEKGLQVNHSLCLKSSLGEGKPGNKEACDLPCDCMVSEWTQWSQCSKTCRSHTNYDTGIQKRTRKITTLPEYGGLPCLPLIEKRHCDIRDLPLCPLYKWHTELEWGQCRLLNNEGLCGAGQQRRQVYCIVEGDEQLRPVEEAFCLQDVSTNSTKQKPPSKRACQVACPQNCQVGEWQNWSPCSQSCGDGGQKVRQREVLVPAMYGGRDCGPLLQSTKCESVDCVWWYTGRWSKCFLDYGNSRCGSGSQVRVLYCKSAMDDVLDAKNCSHLERPLRTRVCKVPCPSDCVVSEWSEWGECSRSCGKKGGVQTRTRQILAYADPVRSSCLPEDELVQTRVCNEEVWCRNYMWQVGPWGDCHSDGQSYHCGPDTGIQVRDVTCEIDTETSADEHLCDTASRPNNVRTCNVSCPIDCMLSSWSDWSECSETCGYGAYKYKTRRILQLSAFGGVRCPREVDDNGVITKRKKCKDLEPCYTYHWEVLEWSECTILNEECGPGYQTRPVFCQRSDGVRVEPGVCLEKLLSARPISHKRCLLPCPGDCVLSEWSEFTACSQTCGDNPGVMMRYRHVTSSGSATSEHCSHIAFSDLEDISPCNAVPCPSYNWDAGPWRSCLLHEGNDVTVMGATLCGKGVQRRSVLCRRNDGQYVENHYCDKVALMPAVHKECMNMCPIDCQVSEWGEWSGCSQNCGTGIRIRYRRIVINSQYGGRICPSTVQSSVCLDTPCELFEWKVSEWSTCRATVDRHCGVGVQTRDVSCLAGDEYIAECALRMQSPEAIRPCELPCPGDCVTSEWSEFSECSGVCPIGGIKSRGREVIRHPSLSGKQCEDTIEFVPCNKAPCVMHNYTTVIGDWTDCQLIAGHCGTGYRQRPINCVREDGITVSAKKCSDFDLTLSFEPCEVECSEDCILTEYTDWSECDHKCGLAGYKTRSRSIENVAKGTGRQCPDELTQKTPCNVEACYNYDWYITEWSSCSIDRKGCGHGEQTRIVKCQRSDGKFVDEIHCALQGEMNNIRDLAELEKMATSLNKTQKNLETRRPCGRPCPGDCQMSAWSEFSPCLKTCRNGVVRSQQVRSRHAINRQTVDGIPCSDNIAESRPCAEHDSLCPNFSWQIGQWHHHFGVREVWCTAKDLELNVTGGCVDELKPPGIAECIPECTKPFTRCHEGACQCIDGFEGDGVHCFPANGCTTDEHCVFEHTYCDHDNQCQCKEGFMMLYDDQGPCAEIRRIAHMTSTLPTSVTSEGIETSMKQTQPGGLWKYVAIAIGVCVAVLVTVLLLVVLLLRKKHTGHAEIMTTATTVEFKHNNFNTTVDGKLKDKMSNLEKNAPMRC